MAPAAQPQSHTMMLPATSQQVLDPDLAAAVAAAVQERWVALPKTGKPQPNEHTVLAGFAVTGIACDADSNCTMPQNPVVIALGSGTKCLGASKRSSAGDVINDSHAEVIARRALLAWLYDQMELALQCYLQQEELPGTTGFSCHGHDHDHGHQREQQQQQQQQQQPQSLQQAQHKQPQQLQAQTSNRKAKHKQQAPLLTWCPDSGRFAFKAGVEVHMYVSQPPCGDASIHATIISGPAASTGQSCESAPSHTAAGCAEPCPATATAPCTGRTGAKLIRTAGARDVHDAAVTAAAVAAPAAQHTAAQPTAAQQFAVPQAHEVEAGAQQLGAARRKPGRGDATLSMSCSDKLARWACLGLQGCLLSSLLEEPLRLASVVMSVSSTTVAASRDDESGKLVSLPGSTPVAEQDHAGRQAAFSSGDDAGTASEAARQALARALCGRMQEVAQGLYGVYAPLRPPMVATVGPPPVYLALAPTADRKVPSGVSINWSAHVAGLQQPHAAKAAAGGTLEVTLAAHGCKAGTSKKGPAWSSVKTWSRLCSASLLQRYVALLEQCQAAHISDSQGPDGSERAVSVSEVQALPYHVLKQRMGAAYQAAWVALRQAPSPLSAWLVKPQAGFTANAERQSLAQGGSVGVDGTEQCMAQQQVQKHT